MKRKEQDVRKALKELEDARKELQRIQEMQQVAKLKVLEASKSLKEEEEYTEQLKAKVNYNSKDYWEKRYEGSESQNKFSTTSDTYEWYVKFESFSHLLRRDIQMYFPDTAVSGLVTYIPGCGNSTLAEDLHAVGMRQIVASDFSQNIIQQMKERTKFMNLEGIEYKEANVFDIKNEKGETYDIILDKGTLDAIASSKEDNTKKQEENIRKYFTEMWRILKKGGVFILISTMTSDILQSLVTSYLIYYSGEDKKVYNASNWSRGHIEEKLVSDGGGTVYYYSLMKTFNLQNRNDIIHASINQLLREAQQMKENEEWEEIDQTTNTDVNRRYERKKDMPLEILKHKPLKELMIDIVQEKSELYAGGFIILKASHSEQDQAREFHWDDNDAFRFVSANPSVSTSLLMYDYTYYEQTDTPYDQFEYITFLSKDTVEAKMSLPYGGFYYFSYVREDLSSLSRLETPKSINEYQSVQNLKEYQKLGQSSMISIRFPLFTNNPIYQRLNSNINQAKQRIGHLRKLTKQFVERNRTNQSTILPYTISTENMQKIQKLIISINFLYPQADAGYDYTINRILGWLYTTGADKYELFLEYDVITTLKNISSNESYAHEVKTEFLIVPFHSDRSLNRIFHPSLPSYTQLETLKAIGEIQAGDQKRIATISFRIPYTLEAERNEQRILEEGEVLNQICKDFREKLNMSNNQSSSVLPIQEAVLPCFNIRCAFCDHRIVDEIQLNQAHILPTGMFDQSMHDFVCCENVENCFNFSSEDITLTPNVLYLHPIYSSFHSSHITIDENDNPSCEFLCKENYSICDLFHPITSMMLSSTASIAPPSDSKSKKNENGNNWKFFLPVLSMDRCLIRCRRCKSHIGEGILKLDESEPIPSADDEFHFKLSDMESVKIFNHSVRLEHWMKNMIPTIISQPQIDQVLVRLCVYVYEKYNQSIMCFYCAEQISSFQQSTTHPQALQEKVLNSEVLIVKILSKDYLYNESKTRQENVSDELRSLNLGLKVSYQIVQLKSVPLNQITVRIPMFFDEFHQLSSYLSSINNGIQNSSIFIPYRRR